MVRGIVNEHGFVRLHEEKQLIAVYQAAGEALVNAGLRRKLSIHVGRGVERIVRRVHIMRQNGGGHPHLVPIVLAKGIGKFLAVKTDFPRKDSVLFQDAAIEFRARGIVLTRQSGEGKWSVVVELNEIRMTR